MIKHPNRIKQVIDFSGFNNKIHPSDIDAVLEFDNKYLFLFEVKLKGLETPVGQDLLLKRIANSWQSKSKYSFVIYCEHNTKQDEFVTLKNTNVVKIYHDKKMYIKNISTYQLLKDIGKHYKISKLMEALNNQ
jgi:hypothetical protein